MEMEAVGLFPLQTLNGACVCMKRAAVEKMPVTEHIR